MKQFLIAALAFVLVQPADLWGSAPSLPAHFLSRSIATSTGAQIYVGFGGSGPAVVLIHGYADTRAGSDSRRCRYSQDINSR